MIILFIYAIPRYFYSRNKKTRSATIPLTYFLTIKHQINAVYCINMLTL